MLHIILFILKIIGILFLVLLGLLLTVVLLVLFVPIRYRLDGSYYGRLKGRAKVTWLLHILSVTASFEEEFTVVVRLFGYHLFKPVKESVEETEDLMVHAMEVTDRKAEAAVKDSLKEVGESGKKDLAEVTKPTMETTKTVRGSQVGQDSEAGQNGQVKQNSQAGQNGQTKKSSRTDQDSHTDQAGQAQEKAPARLWKKFSAFLSKLKHCFRKLCDKLKNIKAKKEEIQAWISDEKNQKTIRLCLKQAKKLIRHILPRKGKGTVAFGFDDPYLTGQVLTIVSLIYPFCHKVLSVQPVFGSRIFTAEGHFKGRIRIGVLVSIAGRLLFDKNFRVLLKRWLR